MGAVIGRRRMEITVTLLISILVLEASALRWRTNPSTRQIVPCQPDNGTSCSCKQQPGTKNGCLRFNAVEVLCSARDCDPTYFCTCDDPTDMCVRNTLVYDVWRATGVPDGNGFMPCVRQTETFLGQLQKEATPGRLFCGESAQSLLPICDATSASIVWTGGGDNINFNDARNWSGNRVPDQTDNVVIGDKSQSPIVLQAPETVLQICSQRPIQIDANGRLEIVTTGNLASILIPQASTGCSLSGPDTKIWGTFSISNGATLCPWIPAGGGFVQTRVQVLANFQVSGTVVLDGDSEIIMEAGSIMTSGDSEFNTGGESSVGALRSNDATLCVNQMTTINCILEVLGDSTLDFRDNLLIESQAEPVFDSTITVSSSGTGRFTTVRSSITINADFSMVPVVVGVDGSTVGELNYAGSTGLGSVGIRNKGTLRLIDVETVTDSATSWMGFLATEFTSSLVGFTIRNAVSVESLVFTSRKATAEGDFLVSSGLTLREISNGQGGSFTFSKKLITTSEATVITITNRLTVVIDEVWLRGDLSIASDSILEARDFIIFADGVLSGEGTLRIGDGTFRLESGEYFLNGVRLEFQPPTRNQIAMEIKGTLHFTSVSFSVPETVTLQLKNTGTVVFYGVNFENLATVDTSQLGSGTVRAVSGVNTITGVGFYSSVGIFRNSSLVLKGVNQIQRVEKNLSGTLSLLADASGGILVTGISVRAGTIEGEGLDLISLGSVRITQDDGFFVLNSFVTATVGSINAASFSNTVVICSNIGVFTLSRLLVGAEWRLDQVTASIAELWALTGTESTAETGTRRIVGTNNATIRITSSLEVEVTAPNALVFEDVSVIWDGEADTTLSINSGILQFGSETAPGLSITGGPSRLSMNDQGRIVSYSTLRLTGDLRGAEATLYLEARGGMGIIGIASTINLIASLNTVDGGLISVNNAATIGKDCSLFGTFRFEEDVTIQGDVIQTGPSTIECRRGSCNLTKDIVCDGSVLTIMGDVLLRGVPIGNSAPPNCNLEIPM